MAYSIEKLNRTQASSRQPADRPTASHSASRTHGILCSSCRCKPVGFSFQSSFIKFPFLPPRSWHHNARRATRTTIRRGSGHQWRTYTQFSSSLEFTIPLRKNCDWHGAAGIFKFEGYFLVIASLKIVVCQSDSSLKPTTAFFSRGRAIKGQSVNGDSLTGLFSCHIIVVKRFTALSGEEAMPWHFAFSKNVWNHFFFKHFEVWHSPEVHLAKHFPP